MDGYVYKKCSRCGVDKLQSKTTYCKACSSLYHKNYRLNKKVPNIKIDGLEDFIEEVIKNKYLVTFDEISTIIFFYQIITSDITEYNRYSTGKQIKLMWDRILQYYNKRKDKQKNI
jgi:hypothetical protein